MIAERAGGCMIISIARCQAGISSSTRAWETAVNVSSWPLCSNGLEVAGGALGGEQRSHDEWLARRSKEEEPVAVAPDQVAGRVRQILEDAPLGLCRVDPTSVGY